MSVYSFLQTIASSLGDDKPGSPFRRYLLRDLVTYYNEAMCFVATHRPDLFTEYKILKLAAGSSQDARCCGCLNVIEVVAQIDANGNTIKDLTSTGGSATNTSKWYRVPCRDGATGTQLIISYKIEPGMNGQFTVTPPVPVGADVWVKLKCVGAPTQYDQAAVIAGASTGACQFLPAIRSYVLYRALQGDRHAMGAAVEAQSEFKNVLTILGIQIKYEQMQETK